MDDRIAELYYEEVKNLYKEYIMPYVSIFERKGIEKGIQLGIQQGIEKGKKMAMIEVTKSLLDVLDAETITRKTGLTLEEIKNLKNYIHI